MDTQPSTEVEKEAGEPYTITRGFQEGKQLTTAQRTSALFAEEPTVLGRVLRRGSPPLKIAETEYKLNELKLLALEKAGAIKIQRPQEKAMSKPCSLCGQVPRGQGGEFKCPECGLPMVTDPANLNPPPKVEEGKEKEKEETLAQSPGIVPDVVLEPEAVLIPDAPAAAPEVQPEAVEPAAEPVAEVVPAAKPEKAEKKQTSSSSKKDKR